MRTNLIFTFLFTTLLPLVVTGQSRADSSLTYLEQRIETKTVDTADVLFFIDEIVPISDEYPARTVALGSDLIQATIDWGWKSKQAHLLNLIGNTLRSTGLPIEAMNDYLEALEIYIETEDIPALVFTHIDLGNIFYDQQNYESALRHYRQVLQYVGDTILDYARAVALNNIALTYLKLDSADAAVEYIRSAYQIRTTAFNDLNAVVHSHVQFAQAFTHLNRFDSAEYHIQKGFELCEKLKKRSSHHYSNRMGDLLFEEIDLHIKQNNREAALQSAQELLLLGERQNHSHMQVEAHLLLSKLFEDTGRISQAISHAERALSMASKHAIHSKHEEALLRLSELYKQSGNYQRAAQSLTDLLALKEVLGSERNTIELATKTHQKEIEFLQKQLETGNQERLFQEQQFESEQKQNQLLIILTITGSLFSVALLVLLLQNRKKTKESHEAHQLVRDQSVEIELANSRLKKANQLLEQSLTEKSNFMSKMSHEIRTPMNAIGGLSQVLLESELTPDQEHLVKNIHHSTQRLTALVDDILDYSRLESGRVRLQKKNFNLQSVVDEIITLHKERAKKNGNVLHLRIDKNVPDFLVGDEDRLGQILNNLISNAVKFTEAGHVYLRVFEDEKTLNKVRLTFEVEDSGIGISSEKLNEIFDDFNQGDSTTHSVYGGTGLGLAICKQLAELMGGSISVQSQKGKGSIFTCSLPFAIGKNIEAHTTNNTLDLKDVKILLAEDDKMNQFVAKRILEPLGGIVSIANNGEEAVEMVEQSVFDIILMDLQMPVLGGLEAAEKILSSGSTSIPIIALTADVQGETKVKAFNSGMVDLVTKPFQKEHLVQSIRRALTVRDNSRI